MKSVLLLLAVVIAVYAIGRYKDQVIGLVASVFDLIINLMRVLIVAVRTVRRFLSRQASLCLRRGAPLSAEQREQGVWAGWPPVGAVINTAYTICFVYAELWIMWLTLGALGFASAVGIVPPVGADLLMAASLTITAAFWGGVLLDALGMSHLGPWGAQGPRGRQKTKWFAVAMLAFTAVIAGSLGLWRYAQLAAEAPVDTTPAAVAPLITFADPALASELIPVVPALPEAEPAPPPLVDERLEQAVPLLVNVGLPVLIALSIVLSAWGAMTLVGLLVGLALGIGSVLFGIVELLIDLVLTATRGLLPVTVNLIGMANWLITGVWNWFAEYDSLEGGRPIKPMPRATTDAISSLHMAGRAKLEAISAEHRRQVYDRSHHPTKESVNDEDREQEGEPAPAGAGVGSAGAAPYHPNGAHRDAA